jgi:hypothetical protein
VHLFAGTKGSLVADARACAIVAFAPGFVE